MKIFTNDEKRLLIFARNVLMNLGRDMPNFKMKYLELSAKGIIKKVLEEDAEDFIAGKLFYQVEDSEPGHFPLPSRFAISGD